MMIRNDDNKVCFGDIKRFEIRCVGLHSEKGMNIIS
jgi:hypothetical protein